MTSKESNWTVLSGDSDASGKSISDYRWKSEAKQDEIRVQQNRIDSNEILRNYCRFYEIALNGFWNGGDTYHPSQKDLDRPEIGSPSIAGIASAAVEKGVGYFIESVAINIAEKALDAIPGGAGKMVETLLTTYHQRKTNNLNMMFSESVLPSERLISGNTIARARTDAHGERIIEAVKTQVDTTTFLKWMKVICEDATARYIDGTVCENENAETARVRTMAFHDAFEFLLASCNPESSGMFNKVPHNVKSLEDILPYQLEWLHRQYATGSGAENQVAKGPEDYKQFVKPGISSAEVYGLRDEPVFKDIFQELHTLRKRDQIHEKKIARLEFDRQAEQTMFRYWQLSGSNAAHHDIAPDGNHWVAAINAFSGGKKTVSAEEFSRFLDEQHCKRLSGWTCAHIIQYVQGCAKQTAEQIATHLYAENLQPLELAAALKQLKELEPDNPVYPGIEDHLQTLGEMPNVSLPASNHFKTRMAELSIEEPMSQYGLDDVALYLDKAMDQKMQKLTIGFFTPTAQVDELKRALNEVMRRDVEVHPENKDGYMLLQSRLAAILQKAIGAGCNYHDAKKQCLAVVKQSYGLGKLNGTLRHQRLEMAVTKAFVKIRDGLDWHEDALYALNAFVPYKTIPVCREFIVGMRLSDGRYSPPFCFRCDERSGQWLLMAAPNDDQAGKPMPVTPRDYFNKIGVFRGICGWISLIWSAGVPTYPPRRTSMVWIRTPYAAVDKSTPVNRNRVGIESGIVEEAVQLAAGGVEGILRGFRHAAV